MKKQKVKILIEIPAILKEQGENYVLTFNSPEKCKEVSVILQY